MPLTTLFLDLNSYFASVEQQLRPELRGKPVGVAAVDTDSTSLIAASYEAKAFGVKTLMNVGEARRRCPGLVVALSRHRAYIEFHHTILAAIDTCIPIQAVHSIDEVSCRLIGKERDPGHAAELALRIKRVIKERAGECLRCSIGIAPNRLLAKIGTELQKPDGLVVIEQRDLPGALHRLRLIEIPGIGPKMEKRLRDRGITTVEQLCALSEHQMERVWGSVVGRRWWRLLRGETIDEIPTHRRSIGHQHVLPPVFRTEEGARSVAIRLAHKAASRMRSLGYRAKRVSLSVRCRDGGARPDEGGWSNQRHAWTSATPLSGGRGSADTLAIVEALAKLWTTRPRGSPYFVAVTLDDLEADVGGTLPLFEQESRREGLSRAIDSLNSKYGRHTVYPAAMHEARDTGRGGIAFSNVPDLNLPD
ncbi:MAG: hypothetical protein KF745_05995 [Phycisphaeraceae bacterium]|nr:hypothetical protein [Phycisphaeraceae bacterium]